MSDSDKARIEELEREVSQLRSQLEQSDEEPAVSAGSYRSSEPRSDGELGEQLAPQSSWPKIVVTSVVIVCVALGLMLAIFQALSASIESMAPKAAGMFLSGTEDNNTESPAAPKKKKKKPSELRAPGL
jgi:hypothetical protein